MLKLMLVSGIGGFIGTCGRFLINRLFLSSWNLDFPAATFTVNILGCFIFGLIWGLLNKNGIMNPKLSALLLVGFCGGFTTFSSFSFETFTLGNNGEILLSLFYVALSIITGLAVLWLGLWIAR